MQSELQRHQNDVNDNTEQKSHIFLMLTLNK